MLRNLRHWMNRANDRNYSGPTEGAVLLDDNTVVMVPHLDNWQESHKILSVIDADRVIATFCNAPKGGWAGTASVTGLYGPYNLYTPGHTTLEASVEEMKGKRASALCTVAEIQSSPERELAARLDDFDWYSHYSDDPGIARAGDTEWRKIEALLTKVDPEVARTLWSRYAPAEFVFPTK